MIFSPTIPFHQQAILRVLLNPLFQLSQLVQPSNRSTQNRNPQTDNRSGGGAEVPHTAGGPGKSSGFGETSDLLGSNI
jgi:hypothetical protein